MAGLIAAVAAGVLAETYRPHAPGVETFLLPARVRDADRWADVHQVAVVVLSLISLVTAVVVVAETLKSKASLRRDVSVAIAAAGAALIAWYTTALVRWDQVALRAVTVGGDIDGYWTAAFDERVRFVLIDNTEVSQSSYAAALALHLVTPVLAVIGLAYLLVSHAKLVRRRKMTS
ncbi:MAG: hypothetical protein WA797_02855 [Acidimicrobiales bacterium]